MTEQNSFLNLQQKSIQIRDFPAKSPLFYYDLTMMGAFYLAKTEVCKELLKNTGFSPMSLPGGRTFVSLFCFEYRKTDIGPYNEVSIAIAAQPEGQTLWHQARSWSRAWKNNEFCGFIINLPVNTEVAYWGGVDFFGFPKTWDDVEVRETAGYCTVTVRDRLQHNTLMEASGRILTSTNLSGQTLKFGTGSVKDGQTFLGRFEVKCLEGGRSKIAPSFMLRTGTGSLGRIIEKLSLSPPFNYIYAPKCQAILFEPDPIKKGNSWK